MRMPCLAIFCWCFDMFGFSRGLGFSFNLWMSPKDVDLTADKLCECPMLNKSSNVLIHIKTGNRPYLINKSEASQSLAAGTIIAAFGRGKFMRHQTGVAPAEGDDPRKQVKYSLSGPDEQVLHNGNLTTVGLAGKPAHRL